MIRIKVAKLVEVIPCRTYQYERVRFHIIRNARIENVGTYQSCMVSKLWSIGKQTVMATGFSSPLPTRAATPVTAMAAAAEDAETARRGAPPGHARCLGAPQSVCCAHARLHCRLRVLMQARWLFPCERPACAAQRQAPPSVLASVSIAQC